jgi:hypothetical protein
VIIVSIATAGLFAWLLVVLARASFEIRVPRALAGARIGSVAARAIRSTPSPVERRQEPERSDPSVVPPEDVELAVRERLYGSSPRARQRTRPL